MGCVRNGIYTQECPGYFVHRLSDGFDVIDGSQDVTCVSARDQLGLVAHQAAKDIAVKLRVGFVFGVPPFERTVSTGGELDPRSDIRFMVESGHDDFRIRRDVIPQSDGQVAEHLCGAGTQNDTFRSRVDVFRHRCRSPAEEIRGLLGDGITGSELDIGGPEIIGDTTMITLGRSLFDWLMTRLCFTNR